jgi:hypothetical protein
MMGVLVAFLLVAACAPHGVRCDQKLQPINAPARSAK